ncbi:MAG: tetratricopeptide repeat protein, partial [Pseudomonadota bacterium]
MLTDRYGNAVSTYSSEARDAYVEGVDLFLGANYGALDAFDRALEADPDFALAHSARARALQMGSRMPEAAAAIADANAAAERSKVTAREQSHLAIYNALLQGRGAAARELICNHVGDHPRDALAAQPATGVFGLIGFSGCDGREAEQLAFVRELEGHYGDDWWFLGQLAFAEAECGAIARSVQTIDRSLAGNPRNANAAHIKAHIHYEQGEAESGAAYLDAWTEDYDRRGALYCHVNWHRALWALELGDSVRAWSILEDNVLPGRSPSPPVNVLTDGASFLFRAELAGDPRRDDLWK